MGSPYCLFYALTAYVIDDVFSDDIDLSVKEDLLNSFFRKGDILDALVGHDVVGIFVPETFVVADRRTGGRVVKGVAEELHELTHIGLTILAYESELSGIIAVPITAFGFLIVVTDKLQTEFGIGSHDTTGLGAVGVEVAGLEVDVSSCDVINA